MNLPYRTCDVLYGDRVTQAPARHAVCLRKTRYRHRPVVHVSYRRYADMPPPVVNDVLVDLIRDGQSIVVRTEVGDDTQLLFGEDLPGRVVRRVQYDCFGTRVERLLELFLVEPKVGRPECDGAWSSPRDYRRWNVVFVATLGFYQRLPGARGGV